MEKKVTFKKSPKKTTKKSPKKTTKKSPKKSFDIPFVDSVKPINIEKLVKPVIFKGGPPTPPVNYTSSPQSAFERNIQEQRKKLSKDNITLFNIQKDVCPKYETWDPESRSCKLKLAANTNLLIEKNKFTSPTAHHISLQGPSNVNYIKNNMPDKKAKVLHEVMSTPVKNFEQMEKKLQAIDSLIPSGENKVIKEISKALDPAISGVSQKAIEKEIKLMPKEEEQKLIKNLNTGSNGINKAIQTIESKKKETDKLIADEISKISDLNMAQIEKILSKLPERTQDKVTELVEEKKQSEAYEIIENAIQSIPIIGVASDLLGLTGNKTKPRFF